MHQIRIHGRGGQGSVVTAELLAIAAFKGGMYSQAFPYLGGGGERRGAPVQAFCRIDKKPIQLKCQIKQPGYIIVQDISLLEMLDVFQGLKKGGVVLLNGSKAPKELGIESEGFKVYNFPATELALEILQKPVMNTAMIGAFAAVTGMLEIDWLKQAIQYRFTGETAEKNILAMEEAFKKAKADFAGRVDEK